MAKNGSATAPMALPLPALTSVPEPQPRTTCIAAPKTKAPPTIANPPGAWAPFSSAPFAASSGSAAQATMPMARSCARSPEASRSRIIRRHGPVKPKRKPSSARPKPSPMARIAPARGPALSATVRTRPATSISTPARDSAPGAEGGAAWAVACVMAASVLAGDLVDHILQKPRHVGHLEPRVRPADHGFGVEAHALDPRDLAQREPVGRGPVAGIAERNQPLALRKAVLGGELTHEVGLDQRRLVPAEPAIMGEIPRLRDGAGARGRTVLGLAVPERLGAGIDERRLLAPRHDVLHVLARGQPLVGETDGDGAWRDLGGGARHQRGLGLLPGVHAAVEHRQIGEAR